MNAGASTTTTTLATAAAAVNDIEDMVAGGGVNEGGKNALGPRARVTRRLGQGDNKDKQGNEV